MSGDEHTYKNAGVDRDRAEKAVEHLRSDPENETQDPLEDLFGGFSSLQRLNEFEEPVLSATCDGVGTKLKLQLQYDELYSAGIDLVAMNVNDILTSGARPLLFLDYIAMEEIDPEAVQQLASGMKWACDQVNCRLSGGETAEMPGFVQPDGMELAGFCVGAAEREFLELTPSVQSGDRIVALPSSGFHANGFSLVRKVLNDQQAAFSESTIRNLLSPTRLYVSEVQNVLDSGLRPSAMAHVTGGGIRDNLSRVLPEHLGARIQIPDWEHSDVQDVLRYIDLEEAKNTFNMGIGWLFVFRSEQAFNAANLLDEAQRVGEVRQDLDRVELEYEGSSD